MDPIRLNNNVQMPLLGLDVFQVTDQTTCKESVRTALEAGYRLIDTAACYGNERAVGEAVKDSATPREGIFLTSKVWIQDASYDKTMRSFERTIKNLQTDYLDLYLIHMPYGDYHGSWRVMEELYRAGKVRAIGVCNFLPDRLVDLILSHEIVPAVNQIELHPFCQQREPRQVMEQYHICPMAWAPFAEGQDGIFQHPILGRISAQYGKTPAQVILRWMRQSNIITIPKSVPAERIRQNFDVEDFVLSAEDMEQVGKLDRGHSMILDGQSLNEVYRLHNIRFEQ